MNKKDKQTAIKDLRWSAIGFFVSSSSLVPTSIHHPMAINFKDDKNSNCTMK